MSDRSSPSEPRALLISQPGLGDLVASRDVRLLLDGLLNGAILDCQAIWGALLFSVEPAIIVRRGEWKGPPFCQLMTWEDSIQRELEQHPIHLVIVPSLATARLTQGDIRFLVNVPLLAGAEVVGCLTMAYLDEVTTPTNYVTLIQAAAANIGGLARVQHENQMSRQKLTQLELFFRIGQNMVSTLDLGKLLTDTTSIATSILNAEASSLMLVDEERGELVFEIALGDKGEALQQARIPINQGIAGWVASHGTPVIVNDTSQDERFSHHLDAQTGFQTHSIIGVPLQIKGKTIGVLEVLNKFSGQGFDQEDLELLMTIAGQAATAIENARLYQSLREERDRILSAQEEVRRELARDLHDGLVQILAAIAMNIEHVERLTQRKPEDVPAEIESLRKLTRQATRQARLLLFEMRPLILESRGLWAALKHYVEQLQGSEDFEIAFQSQGLSGRLISRVERVAFAIVQEAINNIRRHAKCRHVWLRIDATPTLLRIEIEDDGTGFRLSEVHNRYETSGSFGLLNIKERSKLLDAELSIESLEEGRPKGTFIRLIIPLTEEAWVTNPPASP